MQGEVNTKIQILRFSWSELSYKELQLLHVVLCHGRVSSGCWKHITKVVTTTTTPPTNLYNKQLLVSTRVAWGNLFAEMLLAIASFKWESVSFSTVGDFIYTCIHTIFVGHILQHAEDCKYNISVSLLDCVGQCRFMNEFKICINSKSKWWSFWYWWTQ